jgi:hypothetical protein
LQYYLIIAIFGMLKFLLIIPALFLFLSNIPFIQERKMETMQAMLAEGDCLGKNGNMEGVCHKPNPTDQHGESNHSSKDEDCSQPRSETTCICICTFHFVAPEQDIVKFNNDDFLTLPLHSGLVNEDLTDPFLSAPWQPPDLS